MKLQLKINPDDHFWVLGEKVIQEMDSVLFYNIYFNISKLLIIYRARSYFNFDTDCAIFSHAFI